uniref:uncharacterized protein LOC120344943 n=1 Tax=Styela clava TaxID=7725 RepID=UPI00193A2377|nr:uncharacterized protein LOC120344943 [Styela clava]
MNFVRILFSIFLICGLFAEKVTGGVCISKIKDGKLVRFGDCEKNDGSDIVKLIKKSEKKLIQRNCGVEYKSKCYVAVTYATKNITFSDAESICKSMDNSKPSNIYDLTHYQLLLIYLRSMIPTGEVTTAVWTGVEYKNVSLSLPFEGPTEMWYPGFPHSNRVGNPTLTNVGIHVDKVADESNQGIFNEPPSFLRFGVICEI